MAYFTDYKRSIHYNVFAALKEFLYSPEMTARHWDEGRRGILFSLFLELKSFDILN